MSKTLMQIRMKFITQISISINECPRFIINDKLLHESIPSRSLTIGICEVPNGDTFRTMLCSNPVGIRKIYTYSCRGIFVSSEHCRTNDICRHAPNSLFLKPPVHRGMVFKPLRILADQTSTLCCLSILILNNPLPRAFQSQGVTINFYEAIDEINLSFLLFQPLNRILVKVFKVARLIILYQNGYNLLLLFVFSILRSLRQPMDDLTDFIAIHAICLIDKLCQLPVLLGQLRIKSIGNRTSISLHLHAIIKTFNLTLRNTFIEVTGRRLDEVYAFSLVNTLWQIVSIKDNRQNFIQQIVLFFL